MRIDISERAKSAQASPLRKLAPLAEKAKSRGVRIYHLNIGQPDLKTPREILEVINNYEDEVVAYTPSDGILDCKRAWEKYYKDNYINFFADDLIVTSGGSEAIAFAMGFVCDPGDEVIVFEPFYTNYNGFASLVGCKVAPVRTYARDGFRLPSVEKIEEKITEKTKAIIMCNPNNPTGTVYLKEELQPIAKLAKEHGLFILSDETYREFVFDGNERACSMADFREIEQNVIVLDSVSKRFSSCGLRVGCFASKNRDAVDCALKFGQARLSVSTIEQLAAIPALENSRELVGPVISEYKKRRDTVYDCLREIDGVMCLRPEGAFYAFPRLPIDNSEDFARWLLENYKNKKETVMVSPAPGFYATPGSGLDEIRIAYVLKPQDLKKAMELLSDALGKYQKLNR